MVRLPPFVSVIIPAYNRALVLERAIDSVLGQTFRDFEIVVVDDGSTDGTESLPVLRCGDERLRYLRLPENRGVSAARNCGVGETSAPWIAFLDSDDEWLPQKLERQVQWTIDNRDRPEAQIVQTQEIWIRRGVRVNPPKSHEKRPGDLFAASLERCMITPSSVMMQRSLFERMGGFNEALPACEDYDLWLRVTCCLPVGLINDFLLRRCGGHADQLSAMVPMLDRFRVRSILDLLRNNRLTNEQERQAVEPLQRRAGIVAEGHRKRGNLEEYGNYQRILDEWCFR